MRLNKLVGYVTLMLLAVGVGMVSLSMNNKAAASMFGVAGLYQGYYDGTTYDPVTERFVLVDGIPMNWSTTQTDVNMFIQAVSDYLNNTGKNATWHAEEHADERVSVYINTMMGVQANDPRYDINPNLPRYQNGINLAKQLFPAWASIVRQYDAKSIPGASVDWNAIVHSTTSEINGSGIAMCNSGTCNENVDRGTTRQEVPDTMFVPADDETKAAIVFHHPNGTVYTIKKWCGNMIGDESPFPQAWAHQPLLSESTPPGALQLTGVPVTLNFTATAKNTGVGSSTGGILDGWMQQDSQAPVKLGAGMLFGPLGPGAVTGGYPFSFTVQPNTPAGTTYTFWSEVTPSTPLGGTAKSQMVQYVVGYTRSPAVQGLNGDIQAGGGICNKTSNDGAVVGNSNAASSGEYIVAASGLVTNFSSNSAGINNLTLGKNGSYSRTCRPDLLQAAVNGRQATDATLPATADLGALTGPGKPDVYYFDGPVLNLSGTAHSKVTIVATVGSVHITAPILVDSTPAAPRYVPSVGIISQGDITIDPIVTRVDAYLFSNNVIDTCLGATAGSTICTTPQLVVNGFLMARDIHFNRVGALNSSGAQVSEKVVLTPQLYLNPPRFFEASQDDGILQAQGEKQPLF